MDTTSGRLLLVGAFGLGAYNPLGSADLDTIVIPGSYGQNSNLGATLENNYPVAGAAGTLDVGVAGSYIVTHTFTTFNPVRLFVRSRHSTTSWKPWVEYVSTDTVKLKSPAGRIAYMARRTAPPGWLKANGAAISVAAYPELDGAIYCGDAANSTADFGYRCTNGASPATTRSTTGEFIVLPDLRGEFTRGWDDGRGIDRSRAFGTYQSDTFKAHRHTLSTSVNRGVGGISGSLERVPFVSDSYEPETISEGGVETRPRNIALLACISY
ncbi:hypothetical protein HLB01_17885 [Bordetella trematum]|nr:hypothetical protein [Bordetella trematum]